MERIKLGFYVESYGIWDGEHFSRPRVSVIVLKLISIKA
jgi:hypothetical protein